MNLATRNWPPAVSFHPVGTCHFGLPSSDVLLDTGSDWESAAVSIGGWDGGRSVRTAVAEKLNDFKKSMKTGFCSVTKLSSPVILKNQAVPLRRWIAARMRVSPSEFGAFPACSYNWAV